MQEKLCNKGDVIFNKGETGDTFYRVVAGSVEIVDDGKQLVVLKEGQYFGEMAILEAYPRSATAIALEDGTRLEEISESDANNYFSEEPEKVLGFFCHLSDRLRALTNDYNAAVNALENISGKEGQPRDKGLFDKLGKALGGLFSRSPKNEISAETRKFIESADFTKGASLYVEEYAPGTVIFREGEPGRCMYAIHWGTVGIFTGYGTPQETKLTELTTNQFFGEMGMIQGEPRSATAVVLNDKATLEMIGPDDLAKLFQENPVKVEMILKHLSYRLRKLTQSYTDVCAKLAEKA